MLFYTIFLVAMFTAIILIPPLTFIYNKFNLVDVPSPRKVHTVPVPRVGGIAIVIATIIPILWWAKLDLSMFGMLIGIGMLFILGIIDDAKNLSYKSKFIVQIASIVLIFTTAFIDINSSYFVNNDVLHYLLVLAIYFLFILGVTNAINLADGLDGLAGGEALLSFSIIGLLAYEINNSAIVLIVLAVIGSVFGFLRFNTYPAKIFMGDTGSLFLGFVLGALAVALTYGSDNAYAKTLPLLLVGLPIFDTIMVMIIRLYNRQSPFNADRNHLHHKLLDHGYKHYQSVLIIYLLQSFYILTAYFMRYDTELNVVLAFLIISLFAYLVGASHKKSISIFHYKSNKIVNLLRNIQTRIYVNTNAIFSLLVLSILIYSFTSTFNIQTESLDILVLLGGITLLSITGLIFYVKRSCTWLERIAIHVMIVLSIYFATHDIDGPLTSNMHLIILIFCIGLIITLFLASSSKQFVGSPLDFLLIATAIVIPNLPKSPVSDPNLSILVIKLIILFYCIEYILFNIRYNWWAVRTTLALCACVPIFLNYL